jgi:hypothetical protein
VRRAYGLGGQTGGQLAQQELRYGRQVYGGCARPCGQVPGVGQAVRQAAAGDGPEWWLRLPNPQPRQHRDRPERHAVPQVGHLMGLQAEPQAWGAAG